MHLLKQLWREEEGQDLTEYVLLLTFIALTTAALVLAPAATVNAIWVGANNQLSTAGSFAAS